MNLILTPWFKTIVVLFMVSITISLAIRVLKTWLNTYGFKPMTIAAAIYISGVIIALVMLLCKAASPMFQAWQEVIKLPDSWSVVLGYTGQMYGLAVLFALAGNAMAMLIYTTLFPGPRHLREAIRDNDIAIALIASILTIICSWAIVDVLTDWLSNLVPYPQIPNFH